jgi:hypothetical protein
VFFHNGKPIKVEKNSGQYMKIINAFDLPEEEQESVIFGILNEAEGFFEKDGFTISPTSVIYNEEELPQTLADKVRSIASEGLPLNLFAKFWQNIQENPSANSVRELYDFLAYKELPITEDGCFLAYKGLDADGWSISGNKTTKVLKGKVSGGGKIFNGIGEDIEVRRWDVDDDRNNHCSYGLHVGSLDYAQDFAQGMVIVVKVNPKDVVSVPKDCSCQKCRVAAYKVVDIFSQEIDAPVTDEDGDPIYSDERVEYDQFTNRVNRYIENKIKDGYKEVSIRSIQNSFSPEYPSKVRVLNALGELGYVWQKSESLGGAEVVSF